ncbi:MAG: NADH-quinone oxidoreductase subunit M [Deltaproteobacteria bacterium]|nr:NADH-quinone oxidoreductase subunit M [Deltaproteobacteria bacterium]
MIDLWPAILAGAVGALVPRKPSTWQRAGIGVIAALLVLFVMKLWPDAAVAAAPSAPSGEWPHLLTFLIGLPLAGAILMLFMPRQSPGLLRAMTMGILLVDLVASLWLLTVPMGVGWHFVSVHDWIPALGIRWHVAVDGMSLWLVLLTTFITPIAAYVSFGSIGTRIKDLCFSLLLLQAAMLGVFLSLDMFLFYVFWELALVPMYVMIGVWGSADKIKAALKFFLYTMGGSVLLLAALLYLVHTYSKLTGTMSFDYLALNKVLLPKHVQMMCFWGFAIAFFVKVPLFPLHTWLPDAHVQAPTGGSIILAAILLKMGTYAYMRFGMGLFPFAAGLQSATLAGVAVFGGILYGALCSWKQDDLKRLVAYSSVAHLGYVMLGLFAGTQASMQGSLLQQINHGVSTGALFLLVGVIYDRRHTRTITEFGGLAKVMPVYTVVFVIITMASIGVPGTNGFVGEFMVIMGTYGSLRLGKFGGVDAVLAAAGVILAAIYMLSVVQRVFFGPLKNPKNRDLPDLNVRETLALAPLVIMVFVIGLFPSVLLSRSAAAVSAFEMRNRLVWMSAQELGEGEPKLVTQDMLLEGASGSAREGMANTLDEMDRGAPVIPPPPAADKPAADKKEASK